MSTVFVVNRHVLERAEHVAQSKREAVWTVRVEISLQSPIPTMNVGAVIAMDPRRAARPMEPYVRREIHVRRGIVSTVSVAIRHARRCAKHVRR